MPLMYSPVFIEEQRQPPAQSEEPFVLLFVKGNISRCSGCGKKDLRTPQGKPHSAPDANEGEAIIYSYASHHAAIWCPRTKQLVNSVPLSLQSVLLDILYSRASTYVPNNLCYR